MILYKYMSLEAAQDVLSTNTIGFSRPGFFNDPFDTPKAVPTPVENAIEATFANVAAGGKSYIWEKNTAILSLTRTATNSLMWAHYANEHKGVVLAIDTSAAGFLDITQNMVPAHFGSVIYSRRRTTGPYHSNFNEGVMVGGTFKFVLSHYEKWQRLFLHKPIEWAYEEEVRVIKCIRGLDEKCSVNGSGDCEIIQIKEGRPLHCFTIPTGSVIGVYFGARLDEVTIKSIIAKYSGMEYKRAKLDQNNYKIDLIPYP